MTMNCGINWLRARRRGLARAALALFALAWLQTAVVPCAMAYAVERESPVSEPSHPCGHGGEAGHAGHDSPARPQAHCPYCPPAHDDTGIDREHDAECAFPHDPTIDARMLSPPCGPPACLVQTVDFGRDAPALRIAAGDPPGDVPRRPLSVSYCRFIE